LVLVGLELATPIGLTGGLCVWLSVGLALGGFGLTLRCVEARTSSRNSSHCVRATRAVRSEMMETRRLKCGSAKPKSTRLVSEWWNSRKKLGGWCRWFDCTKCRVNKPWNSVANLNRLNFSWCSES
ncbi:hypothetical protein C2E31_16135, partial [Rhodopirellula baltica]